MAKLWGGRFQKGLDDHAKILSFSLDIDQRLLKYDIKVNKAHALALEKAGLFSQEEREQVHEALDAILDNVAKNPELLDANDEDVHSYVERLVTESCGDLGKKMHTGKSRNDQVITDVRLFQKEAIIAIKEELIGLLKSLWTLASRYETLAFAGFTHLQVAQPVLLSHHLLAYVEQFRRDLERFEQTYERTDVCPLGAAAMAGNNYDLDRKLISDTLGFSDLSRNSMDAVSDRDFMVECCSNAALVMLHLSRFCEELILWSSSLTGFITIGDDFTTGSSIMPQKKNPDIAELIRGKSARVSGNLTALQQLIKGLPLTYNRDLQEDKEILFDSVDTVILCLTNMAKMLNTITFHPDAIQAELAKGHPLATELADYLVKKGVPFRDAHHITGQCVLMAVDQDQALENIPISEYKKVDERIEEDVFVALTIEKAIESKSVYGGTSYTQVKSQLNTLKEEFGW